MIKSEIISKFKGINRRESVSDGEFLNMTNVCADEYPCLKTLRAPLRLSLTDTDGNAIENIRAVISSGDAFDNTFTGVAGTRFYYKSKKISFYGDASIPETGNIQLSEHNGNIIICCYSDFDNRCLLYYNYHGYASYPERTSAGYVVRFDCIQFVSAAKNWIKALPAAVSSSNLTTYRIIGDSPLYVSNFKVGDSIVIDNLKSQYNENNGTVYQYARETLIRKSRYESAGKYDEITCIVTAVSEQAVGSDSTMDYKAYNIFGSIVEPKGYISASSNENQRYTSSSHYGAVIRRAMPIMNHICIHNNRVWGVNPNGEYIYASKPGEFREFNSFKGLSSDSYYAGVGSPGEFTGIVSYKNNILAFKKDCVHIISGTAPSNFNISRNIEGIGCIDIRSCAISGGYLYFLGHEGFYRFDGISFELISQKLCSKFENAYGFGLNGKYYACVKNGEAYEILIYDGRYNIWHSVSAPGEIVGFFADNNRIYFACSDAVYLFEGEENSGWSIENSDFYNEDCSNDFINEIWIRAKIAPGKEIRVFTNADNNPYIEHEKCMGDGNAIIYRIPVRWVNAKKHRIRLDGNGDSVIYSIELKKANGGRHYKDRS